MRNVSTPKIVEFVKVSVTKSAMDLLDGIELRYRKVGSCQILQIKGKCFYALWRNYIQNSKAHNFVFKSIELDLALNPDSHTQCDLS